MGRPIKKGLKYFNIDCVQEDNLNYVEAKHGIIGYGVLVKLWRKIYMVDGYFTDWHDKNIYLFAREISVEVDKVKEVVETCFEEGIFNRDVYDKFKILTSAGIQKRYLRIVQEARRKDCEIEEKYSLLELTPEKDEFTPVETKKTPALSTQIKQKEKKVNKKTIIGHAPTKKKFFTPPDEKQVKEYFLSTIGNPKKNNPWPEDKCSNEAFSFVDYYTANGWVQGRGKKIIDWKAACRNWIRNELKGIFKQSPAPERKNTPPAKPIPPPVDKIKNELSYLQDMFNEDESKVTIISIETEHYDYLKRNGKINFTEEKKTEIQQLATGQLNGNLNEKSLLNMMKRYGVIEYFKQLKSVPI